MLGVCKKIGYSKEKRSGVGPAMNSWSYWAPNNCVFVLTVQPPVTLQFSLFWGCCTIHLPCHDLLASYLYVLNSSASSQLFQIKHAKHWAGLASSTLHHVPEFCTVLRWKFEQYGHMSVCHLTFVIGSYLRFIFTWH